MRLWLVWYGNMWKAIEESALSQWHSIWLIVDWKINTLRDLVKAELDIVMDFSSPESALKNLEFYAENNLKVVMGTTWWNQHLDEVKELFNQSKWALIWSGNFSLWVILYNEMLRKASTIMNKFENYDVMAHEFHHKDKKDSPSWTLLQMWDIILENIDRKSKIQVNALSDRAIEEDEIHLSSTRWWFIPWTHQAVFDSEFDSIELKHTARNKWWFALGAIECAKWLEDKQGYFEIEDYIKTL